MNNPNIIESVATGEAPCRDCSCYTPIDQRCACGKLICDDCRHICENCGEYIGCIYCMRWDWEFYYCGIECETEFKEKEEKC